MPDPLEIPNLGMTQNQEPPSQSDGNEFSDFANQYLNGVEEADRPIVSKYLKNWDGSVTQRFQELNNKLRPYEELGVPIDSIKYAVQVLQFADQNPKQFYDIFTEQLRDMGLLDDTGGQSQAPSLPEFEGVPQEFVSQFQSLKSELDDLKQFKSSFEQERQSKDQQAQLDNLLKTLENEHGKFDEAAVLGRILRGMDPNDAVKDYQKMIKELSTPARQSAPPVGGSGRVAAEQVDASKIRNDKKARTGLVADILSRMEK